jgi:hypothetical protein
MRWAELVFPMVSRSLLLDFVHKRVKRRHWDECAGAYTYWDDFARFDKFVELAAPDAQSLCSVADTNKKRGVSHDVLLTPLDRDGQLHTSVDNQLCDVRY